MRMIALLCVVALAGCQTLPPAMEPRSEVVPQGKIVPRSEKITLDAHEARLMASNLARALRAKVVVRGADEDSAADAKLAEVLAPIARRSLANAGFEVVFNGDAELLLTANASLLGGLGRGTRTACRGTLEVNFLRIDGRNEVAGKEIKRVVGSNRFDAKSKEARSQEEALMSLGDAFSAPVGKWVREVGAKIAGELAICEVTLRSADGHTPIDGAYPTEFVKTVMGIRGIRDCRVAPLGNAGTVLRAVIAYEPRQIPEGVLNRLASMKSLKIERK